MSPSRDSWSRWLLAIAVAALVVGLVPRLRHSSRSADGVHETEITIGLRFSPLWRYEQRQQEGGTFSTVFGIPFPSWSWLSIAVAAGCLEWRRRRVIRT